MPNKTVKTYKIYFNKVNQSKVDLLPAIFQECQEYMTYSFTKTYGEFVKTGDYPKKYLERYKFGSLSVRYKKYLNNTVKSNLESRKSYQIVDYKIQRSQDQVGTPESAYRSIQVC